MDVEITIEIIGGILFVIFSVGLIIWAERDIKRHF
jgi:hypothetical protein